MVQPNVIILATQTDTDQPPQFDKVICRFGKKMARHFKDFGKRAIGTSIYHCIQLAHHHEPNFWERVVGYRVITNSKEVDLYAKETGKEYISVAFYEMKGDDAVDSFHVHGICEADYKDLPACIRTKHPGTIRVLKAC